MTAALKEDADAQMGDMRSRRLNRDGLDQRGHGLLERSRMLLDQTTAAPPSSAEDSTANLDALRLERDRLLAERDDYANKT